MVQEQNNAVPIALAVLMHVLLFGSLAVVVDFGRSDRPAMLLAIKATLVTDNAIVIPPKVEEPPPDTREQERIEAEEQKRLEDARIERERREKVRQQAERQRIADAERRKQEQEERERERLAELERKRQQEVQRQREENERLRREAESEAREAEINAESEFIAAVDAGELAVYQFAIQQKVRRNWIAPASSPDDLECTVRVQQLPGGEVVTVTILGCNGDAAVRRSIEAAIHKASPLPTPANPILFDRTLRFTFRPEQ